MPKDIILRHFVSYDIHADVDQGHRPHGGVSLLIKNNIPQSQIPLRTKLKAVAAQVTPYPINQSINQSIAPSLFVQSTCPLAKIFALEILMSYMLSYLPQLCYWVISMPTIFCGEVRILITEVNKLKNSSLVRIYACGMMIPQPT